MLMSKLERDQSRLPHATIQTCKVPKGQTHLNLSILSSLALKAVSPQTDLYSYTSSEIPEFWWKKAQIFKLFSSLLTLCHQAIFPTHFIFMKYNWISVPHGLSSHFSLLGIFPCGPFFGCQNPTTDFNIKLLQVGILCAFFLLILINKKFWCTHPSMCKKGYFVFVLVHCCISLISKSHNMKQNFYDTCEYLFYIYYRMPNVFLWGNWMVPICNTC